MKSEISVIITAKDVENERLQKTINCVRNWVEEVIVVDYNSKVPVEVVGAKVYRNENNHVWNKAHALNWAIKNFATQPYIMNLDADILVTEEVMAMISFFIRQDTFLYNTNVRRINEEDIGDWEKSWSWFGEDRNSTRVNSSANGGIQVFSKKWIEAVNGYDEDMILWGAEDNDIYYRAILSDETMINLNSPIYHVEHPDRKYTDEDKKEIAEFIRKEKTNYMWQKIENRDVVGKEPWGEDKPNQSKYIDLWDNWETAYPKLMKEREKSLELIRLFMIKNKLPIKRFNVDWSNGM